jgi:hypothetical protein
VALSCWIYVPYKSRDAAEWESSKVKDSKGKEDEEEGSECSKRSMVRYLY